MKTENTADTSLPGEENPINVETIAKKYGIERFQLYQEKKGKVIITFLWLDEIEYATTKLTELVTQLHPKEIECVMGRSDDTGSYANITFPLIENVKITGAVFFENYRGNFLKTLTDLGYIRTEWLEHMEQGKYTHNKKEK